MPSCRPRWRSGISSFIHKEEKIYHQVQWADQPGQGVATCPNISLQRVSHARLSWRATPNPSAESAQDRSWGWA